jgi:hypothetical protein
MRDYKDRLDQEKEKAKEKLDKWIIKTKEEKETLTKQAFQVINKKKQKNIKT